MSENSDFPIDLDLVHGDLKIRTSGEPKDVINKTTDVTSRVLFLASPKNTSLEFQEQHADEGIAFALAGLSCSYV